MKWIRRITIVVLFFALAQASLAQDAAGWRKLELYGGYSRSQVKSTVNSISFTSPGGPGGYSDLCSAATGEMLGRNSQEFFCKGRSFDGFDLSATYNVNRYWGITANVTGTSRDETFVDDFGGIIQTIGVDEKLYSAMAGIRLKDNSTSGGRLRPFAHALVGAARYENRQRQSIDAFPEFDFVADDHDTSLTLKIGGGLDLNLGPHVDLRVIEVDYQPVFAGDRGFKTVQGPFTFNVEGKTAQNYTFGFGIVIH